MLRSPSKIMTKLQKNHLGAIFKHCSKHGLNALLTIDDIFILIVGVVSNATLLWLFLRGWKSLSASQVLGVNLFVMNLIYVSLIPVSLILDPETPYPPANHSDLSTINWEESINIGPVDMAKETFSMFNLIGCPLLLACMCVERYLAVVKPVLYLRVRKWEYRVAVSAVVWCITLSFCLTAGLVQNIDVIMVPVVIIISCLFLVMLACLVGVIWSVQQESPARTTPGNQTRSESPLKRRVVFNVLVVVVPAVGAYLPVLLMIPLILSVVYGTPLDKTMCNVLELCHLFPRVAVIIGPMFYFSKVKQMCCPHKGGKE